VKGRKRHALVDTQGWLWGLLVTPANVQDKAGARWLAAQVAPLVPRLTHLWADGGFASAALVDEYATYGWTLEVVEPPGAARGFTVVPKRWIVERTFGWWGQQRRLRIDYEERLAVAATFIHLAMIGLMARRLAHDTTS
jgi:putative transposase